MSNYDDWVEVITEADAFEADYVICTLPLGKLQSLAINFDPPLSDAMQQALLRQGTGSVTKVAFRFPEARWDSETQYLGWTGPHLGRWAYAVN